jgi:diketogulonate reductase-like aldo/keto reductase
MSLKISRRNLVKAIASLPLISPLSSLALSNQQQLLKKIPSNNQLIPAIGMGSSRTFDVDLLDKLAMQSCRDVLSTFYQMGGTVIDSSPMYGRSEQVLGKIVKQLRIENKLFTATKVWTDGQQPGINQMRESMQLLNDKPLDLMQVHNLRDLRNHLKTLKTWREQGIINYIGVTTSRVSVFPEIAKVMRTEPIDFVQFNYSIDTTEAEQQLLPLARDKGIATMINRPFERAALFRKVAGKALPEWARDYQINSWAQWFLKFIISNPDVTCVIPATSKVKHMQDNMMAGLGPQPGAKVRQQMIDFMQTL